MANRFDVNRPENFQYTSQYIPLPLEAISHMANQYSDRYHKGRAIPGQLDLLASKIQAAPHDYVLKDKYLKDVHAELDPLVQNAKPEDWANPQFQDKMNQIITRHASDPILNTIAINKQKFDKHKTDDPRDLDFTYQRGNDAYGTTYMQNENSNVMGDPKITKWADSNKAMSEIMSGIHESGNNVDPTIDYTKGIEAGPNNTYRAYSAVTHDWKGITADKVKQIADISTDLFGNGEAGKYEVQKTLRDAGLGSEAYNWDWNKLKNVALQNPDSKYADIYNNLYSDFNHRLLFTGAKQVGVDNHTRVKQDLVQDELANKTLLEKPQFTPVWESPVTNVPGQNLDTSELKQGTLSKIVDDFSKSTGMYFKTPGGIPNPSEMNEKEGKVVDTFIKDFYPDVYKTYSKTGKLSDDEKKKIYPLVEKQMEFLNKDLQTNSTVRGLSAEEDKQVNSYFGRDIQNLSDLGTGNGQNSKYMIKTEDGVSKPLSYPQLLDKLGANSDEAKKIAVTIKGKFDPKNPYAFLAGHDKSFATPYQLNIGGQEIIMSGPQQYLDNKGSTNNTANHELTYNKYINEVNNLKYSPGIPKDITINNGEKDIKAKIMYWPPDNRYHIIDKNKDTNNTFSSPEEIVRYLTFTE